MHFLPVKLNILLFNIKGKEDYIQNSVLERISVNHNHSECMSSVTDNGESK